jgi:Fe-S-cluster containining protein
MCGLCCNGAFYTSVTVLPDHVPMVAALGLTVTEESSREFSFRQPCPLYKRDCCSVYPRHPPSCQSYRCALLRKYEAGETSLDEAMAIVRTTKEVAGDSRGMGQDALAAAWDEETGLRGRDAVRKENAATLLRAATLDVLRQKRPGDCSPGPLVLPRTRYLTASTGMIH